MEVVYIHHVVIFMFDGLAFKKSDILTNGKINMYLFFFESSDCGRAAPAWCKRPWSGNGQENQ